MNFAKKIIQSLAKNDKKEAEHFFRLAMHDKVKSALSERKKFIAKNV